MDEALVTPPLYKLPFSDQVYAVEFSPYEWSHNLVLVALSKQIVIGTIRFQEDDDISEDITYSSLQSFHHDTRIQALAWSPETSLSVIPKVVAFCAGGADYKIRLYTSNLNGINVYEILEGHKDYVNAIAYEPEGENLASVSDDHTCKLWLVKEEQKCISTFYLTSPGTSVRWHVEESGKLLVAEKNGLIHMYNVVSQQAIMSLDAGTAPLMWADWSLDPLKVACLAAGELLIWDVTRPSRPSTSSTLHIEGGLMVKFSPANENLLATLGKPDNLLKITNLKSKQVVLCGAVRLFGGISWHQKLPYICAGNDRELHFWRVSSS